MPICIAGMHRSGTSMVAKMLNLVGLWLGAEEELYQADSANEDGFFENRHLVELNSDLLTHLGGGWDVPPTLPIGWELAEDLQPFRIRAADIVQHIGTREPWGWKDPRNTLTLPFWRQLLPGLRVVVCVRHPMEVARSLQRRGQSTEVFGVGLWLAYNKTALDIPSAARVVTHYEAYFEDPRAELQRVLRALDLPADDDTLTRGCAGISPRLRHSQADVPIPEHLRRCYAMLCHEAGPVYQLAAARHTPRGALPDALGLAIVAKRDAEQALESLRGELATLQQHAVETELRLEGELSQARIQLRESEALRGDLDLRLSVVASDLERTSARIQAQQETLQVVRAELQDIKTSSGWALLERLWRIRLAIAPHGSRRERWGQNLARALRRERPANLALRRSGIDQP